MARPRIAIPARFSDSASALRYAAEVTSRNLVEAVFAAGGEPLVVHPHAPGGVADPDEVAERLAIADGVLLPGGGDVAAHRTGQDTHETLYDVDHEQDGFDLAVAEVALSAGLPLLAVCRGLQVVNALRGGTVVQDMDESFGEQRHHRHRRHVVEVETDGVLYDAIGAKAEVSCYHHQCIDRLGNGLRVRARAEDGVVEAVDLPESLGWFLGVQWHPEDTWATDEKQVALVRALVDAARR